MKLVFINDNFKPKIAILLPAYNEENNIEYSYECLSSEFKNLVEKNIISATQWEAGATNSSKITRGFSNTFAR